MIIRISITIGDSPFRTKLLQALTRLTSQVEITTTGINNWHNLLIETSDIIFIHRNQLPDPLEQSIQELQNLPESPMIIMYSPHESQKNEAHYVSLGCEHILTDIVEERIFTDLLESFVLKRRETRQQQYMSHSLSDIPRLADFITQSPIMKTFLETVYKIVDSNVSTLILGETGVGKERLARAIHHESQRKLGPFIAINCGALPESLLESELFGHEKGAFTGAIRLRRGCFELAHGGTLFLDEVGDLPLHLQVKLLRVLQEKEIQRVGSENTITVDVRIVAATNKNLDEQVEAKTFRRDLYYRLGVITLNIPPLKERSEDIPILTMKYINYLRSTMGKEVYRIDQSALDTLCNYSWPGNIRELINVLERAILLCDGEIITLEHLPLSITMPTLEDKLQQQTLNKSFLEFPFHSSWLQVSLPTLKQTMYHAIERQYLEAALKQTKGKIKDTADIAGISERSLFSKMQTLKLDKKNYK